MLSALQDLRMKANFGAVIWFLVALVFTGAVIWLGIGARIWGGAFLGAASFCLEIWLMQYWWRKAPLD